MLLNPLFVLLPTAIHASSIIPTAHRRPEWGLPLSPAKPQDHTIQPPQVPLADTTHKSLPPPLRLEAGGARAGRGGRGGKSHPFEPEENSVGLLLTYLDTHNDEDESTTEVQHFWMPLGKKVYTRDHPSLLPAHPLTARLTTLIHTSPSMASLEALEQIRCTVRSLPVREPRPRHGGEAGGKVVEFGREEGLVRFVSGGTVPETGGLDLGDSGIESWECA